MTATTTRTRVTRVAEIDPGQLLANPKNYRIHPRQQAEELERLLVTLGWVKRVIVQEGSDLVLDGHLRVQLALRRDEERIPVAYVDVSDEEADLLLAALDASAELAVSDHAKLRALLDELPDLSGWERELRRASLAALSASLGDAGDAGAGAGDADSARPQRRTARPAALLVTLSYAVTAEQRATIVRALKLERWTQDTAGARLAALARWYVETRGADG